MTRDEVLQDLAYARALAEEGRHAPLIGGSYFVLFGVLLAIAYSAQWSVLSGAWPVGQQVIGFTWIGFGAAAAIGVTLLSRRVRKLPGGAAISNQVDRAVWNGAAIAIIACVVGAVLRAMVTHDFTAPDAIMAAGFGLYGVAIYASARAGGHPWLQSFAWIAWAVSAALWFFMHEVWTYLVAAAACVIVLIAPGIMMLRREPAAMV